jgi:hypothetical protein
MSPGIDFGGVDVSLGPDDDFILIRVLPSGDTTTFSTMDEEDAVELLRWAADDIESDGFERLQAARLS